MFGYGLTKKGNYFCMGNVLWIFLCMTVEREDYKLEVLEYAVNQCIDRLLPESNKNALSVIIDRSNEVVWRVATDIYTKSGHKIDFSFVRNLLNLRIEPLRIKIAEEVIIKAELEAQRQIRKAKEELEVFERIKNIIVEELEVDEKLITLDYIVFDFNWSYFSRNDNAYLDLIEFVMAIEKEFDIEIPDEEQESLLSRSFGEIINFVLQKI
jgi:acyl carrier protein